MNKISGGGGQSLLGAGICVRASSSLNSSENANNSHVNPSPISTPAGDNIFIVKPVLIGPSFDLVPVPRNC